MQMMEFHDENCIDNLFIELKRNIDDFENDCKNINNIYLQYIFATHQSKIISTICKIKSYDHHNYYHSKIKEITKRWGDIMGRDHEFVRRIQTWPEGFPGDSKTVNMMLSPDYSIGQNHSILHQQIDKYLYTSAIIQQHRNKLDYQSKLVIDCLLTHKNEAKILMLACGKAPELEKNVLPILKLFPGAHLVLNDKMKVYLEETMTKWNLILGNQSQLSIITDNTIKFVMNYNNNNNNKNVNKYKYHLVTAGGLFDYLDDKISKTMVDMIMENMLTTENGQFFFTNIDDDMYNRALRVYMSRWQLIERTESDLLNNVISKKFHNFSKLSHDLTHQTIYVTINATSLTSSLSPIFSKL
jgi:hypothetical protein